MEFSILVPVYRAEAYLEAAVRSALNQSYKDFEILLVEDGSPDGSGAVMDRLAEEYPALIRAVHCPHRGTVLTRREALRLARGEFAVWLDADDLLEPELLEVLHETRRTREDPDVILYNQSAFYEDGRPGLTLPPLFAGAVSFRGEAEKRPLYELLIRGSRLDSLCKKAIRTCLLQEDPSDYGPAASNPYGEDVLHCLWPLTRAKSVVSLEQSCYRYRIHSGSVMHVFDKAALNKRFNEAKFDFFAPFMKSWGLDDEVHRDLLRASSCKTVLEGVFFFMEGEGYDRREVLAYARGFAGAHPEMKRLARCRALGLKDRVILGLFVRGQVRLLFLLLKLYRKVKH